MPNDKYETLLKETWQNLRIAIVLIIALMIILGLGILGGEVIKKGGAILTGFLLWIFVAISAIGWAILILFIIREYKINHFRKWGDSWKDNAERALNILEKDAIKSQIMILHPEDYVQFLFNEGQVISANPVTNIRLVGSMVGFYILLPAAIRNYICHLGNKFHVLSILATHKRYSPANPPILAYYAFAFVAKTLEAVLYGRCKKCFKQDEKMGFEIHLRFSSSDFLNAAIMMKDRSVAILQALDPESATKIIDDGIQLGLNVKQEYDNNFPIGQAYFSRYKKVIDGLFDEYTKFETWKINGNKSEIKLVIENRCWDDNYNFNELDNFAKIEKIKNNTRDDIKDFLKEFKTKVCKDAETTNVDSNHDLISKFDIPCDCEKKA
jgi:uncharacterized membrane protein